MGGLANKVLSVTRLDNGTPLPFQQSGSRLQIRNIPEISENSLWPVVKIACKGRPEVYQTGGLRIPQVAHPHYDPCPSDIAH